MAKADMFLKLTGQRTGAVGGESDAKGHAGEMEITGFSWGMSSSSAFGGAGAAAKTALSEVNVVKRVDRASTQLMTVMRNNEPVKEAVISVRKAGVNPPFDYLVVTMLKGRITKIEIANETPGLPELTETLSIAFEQIEIAYNAQDAQGGKQAGSVFTAQVNPS